MNVMMMQFLLAVGCLVLMTLPVVAGNWSTIVPPENGVVYEAVACLPDRTCFMSGQFAGATFDGKMDTASVKPVYLQWGEQYAMAAAQSTVVTTGLFQHCVQYFDSSNTSFVPAVVPVAKPYSQSVGMSSNGKTVVIPLTVGAHGIVLVSNDEGRSFEQQVVRIPLPRGAEVSVSVIDSQTWYLAGGARIPNTVNYSALILRTLDGGMTYQELYSTTSNIVFRSIACQGLSTCVAVANAYGSVNAGVYVYRTSDGTTWSEVYMLPSYTKPHFPVYSVKKVMFSSKNTVWVLASVSGGRPTGTVLLRSRDAGETWEITGYPEGASLVITTDFTFLPDGSGFAIGIPESEEFTYFSVLRFIP